MGFSIALCRAVVIGLVVACLPCLRSVRAADPIAADPPLRWWKGNLHTHTLWSDGDNFPEMAAEWYRERDYHFLALSDHDVLSQGQRWMAVRDIEARAGRVPIEKYVERFGTHWVERRTNPQTNLEEIRLKPLSEFRALVEERGRFLMIQSEEISAAFQGSPVHVNATNILERIEKQTGSTLAETIEMNMRAVKDQAQRTGQEMLPHVNHPNFEWAMTAEDLAAIVSEPFFEVYNGHPMVNQQGDEHRPSLDRMWDIANTLRVAKLDLPPLYGLATDDTHNYHFEGMNRAGPGRGWILVRARHLTPESILRAMRAGDFYASTGVTLSDVVYSPDSRTIEIAIVPEEGVTYTTEFVGTPKVYDDTVTDRQAVGPDGKPIRTTRNYSDQVGMTFAKVEGTQPAYKLTGDELYVRAIVTASAPAEHPSFEGQLKQAWTQPVGWQK